MKIGIVVPLYNEELRFAASYFEKIALNPIISMIFVDDGSKDQTASILKDFVSSRENTWSLVLDTNIGKANAIRAGWVALNELDQFDYLGFLDADGAFSTQDVDVLVSLCDKAESHSIHIEKFPDGAPSAYWSSRIHLSGRNIQRSKNRYLLGRILANVIKIFIWDLPWDTQSGYKLFRNDDHFKASIQNRFKCRWLFDIELLQNLRRAAGDTYVVWEEPVTFWKDVPGSKVSLNGYFDISRDFFHLVCHYGLRRRRYE